MFMNIKLLASGHINLVVIRILIYLLFSVSLVRLKQKITKPNPEPGEILQSLKREISGTDSTEIPSIESLEEQKKVAEEKLEFFLSNISASPESRKVVEQFYEEEHDKKMDASEIDMLRENVPSIDSIIYKDKLPIVNKDDLRNHFDVASASEATPLSPESILKREDGKQRIAKSSGTTGPEWKRIFTRNDWGMTLIQGYSILSKIIENSDIELKQSNTVMVMPPLNFGTELFHDLFEMLGSNVRKADLQKLGSGGQDRIKETRRLTQHLERGKYSLVMSSLEQIMQGSLGVAIRRGEIDADAYVNIGKPFPEEHRNMFESRGLVGDIYGETEYPQGGGLKRKVGELTGFDLPFESQINLIYNEDTEELSYEGTGRFAYLPFGNEGQVIPGVYVSGIVGTIEKVGDGHQLLSEVMRVENPDRGCYASIH
jgi:hypothetical protein